MDNIEKMSPNEIYAAASEAGVDPSKYTNDPIIEYQWAMKAYNHAETYFNILCAVDTQFLKLTKIDDEIYNDYKQNFTDFSVQLINENELKSNEAKEVKWRPFCENYKGKVEDYNFATLLRIDSNKDYCEENTIIVPRIQFYAIEIARNREGHNKIIKSEFKIKSKLIDTNNNN